jgi:hypothetical protein
MTKAQQRGVRRTMVVTQGTTKRLQFDFPTAAIGNLKRLAVMTGEPTLAGVLRDALKVYTWILTEQQQCHRIIAEDQTGQIRRELVPLLKPGAL